MTTDKYYRILDALLKIVSENKTKEFLHIYNEFKRQLRKELDINETYTGRSQKDSQVQ